MKRNCSVEKSILFPGSILPVVVLCLFPYFIFSQSTMEFQSGTTIEVTAGADICAENIIINGTYFGNGTKCGGTLFLPANLKAFLQGPYSSGAMTITLNSSGLIPLSQPYKGEPWNYTGTESVGSIPAGVVDWILVELRTGTTADTKIASRAGFVKSNGAIVDVDGTDQLRFNVSDGKYYAVIRHRNHLAIMSNSTVALSSTSDLYDFTTAQTKAYGTYPMKDLGGGALGMYAADANGNGQVQNNDSEDYWKVQNGQSGYRCGDFNLNGQVQNNDSEDFFKNNNGKGTQVP